MFTLRYPKTIFRLYLDNNWNRNFPTFLEKLAEKSEKWTVHISGGKDFSFENYLGWSFFWKKVVGDHCGFPAGTMTRNRLSKQNLLAELPKFYMLTFFPIDSAPDLCIETFLSFTELVMLFCHAFFIPSSFVISNLHR